MYHKISPKISIYINICCGPIVKENIVGNAQIPLLYKVGVNTLVFSMVADFFSFTIRSIIWKQSENESVVAILFSMCNSHVCSPILRKKAMTCEDYNKNKLGLNAT